MSQESCAAKGYAELCRETPPPATGLLLFGASGDLAKRKLFPALCKLGARGLLPEHFFLLGCSRTAWSDEAFQNEVAAWIKEYAPSLTEAQRNDFKARCFYLSGDYSDPTLGVALRERFEELARKFDTGTHRLFYFSTPPNLYAALARSLKRAGFLDESRSGWSRVILEKPFGYDLESARLLDKQLQGVLTEKQTYRIDHYLGKETVQNILMFRFMNRIFEPLWNNAHIDHVQLSVLESVGLENRAAYYEKAGVIRDMFQNHLLQVLSLLTMEAPTSFEPDAIQEKKIRLIEAIRPLQHSDGEAVAVRGQYGEGTVDGAAVPAYRSEPGIAPTSNTETFAAMRLEINTPRWQGVPFYLRCGKSLKKKVTEAAIYFKSPDHSPFPDVPASAIEPNVLTLNIHPEESFALTIHAKRPGPKLCTAPINMDFCYHQHFGVELPEAYERLLLDAMLGDQTLFIRRDMLDASWQLFTPLIKTWETSSTPLNSYPAGSWGPDAADRLIERDGRQWRHLDQDAFDVLCRYTCPGCKAKKT